MNLDTGRREAGQAAVDMEYLSRQIIAIRTTLDDAVTRDSVRSLVNDAEDSRQRRS